MDDTARMRNPPVSTQPVAVINAVKISPADIPSSIKIKGKIQEAWQWTDSLGDNILVTAYVAPYNEKNKKDYGDDARTAELHAVHYAQKHGKYVPVSLLDDAEKGCPFDITCDFIPGSTTITDLDKDGIAETKLQYSMACRSDVSPAVMKLVMYENGIKHTLQGNRWLAYSPDFKFTVTEKNANLESSTKLKDETDEMLRTFGRYKNEKEFANASPEFIVYARKEWIKHVMEKIGE